MEQYLKYSLYGFVLGIIFSSFVSSLFFIFSSIFIFLVFLILYVFSNNDLDKKILLSFSVFFLVFSFGQFRFYLFEKSIKNDLNIFENKKVYINGKVFRQTESDGNLQKIYLEVYKIKDGLKEDKISGRVLVFAPLYPKIHIGENISVFGKIQKPEIVENGGKFFDYPKYLKKDKITHLIYFGNIKKEETVRKLFSINSLFYIKDFFVNSLSKVLKEPELSLSAGVIFGADSVPKDIDNMFKISGLSHITVLSGYNITVLSDFILKTLTPLTSFATSISIFSIFIFVFASGISATSVRALIMASIAIVARRFGRTYQAFNALILALFLIAIFNPFTILYDSSFHLSFLATLAIIFLTRLVYSKIRLKEGFLKEILATTISAQMATIPYILFMTSKISVYSLISNILVLPFVPVAMFLGFLVAFLAYIPFIGISTAFLLHIILKYFIFVANSIGKIPYSSVEISFGKLQMFICYFLLVYFWFKYGD